MITPRLQCILDNTSGKVIADIGTDHAYIPIKLMEDGLAERVIASDIKSGPTEIAEQNVKKHGLEDKIEVRLGGGLSVLGKNEADTVIIAGMGGEMTENILRGGEEIARAASLLVLQPMNSQYELRKYLLHNGYSITGEDIAVEGFKVYNVLTVRNGEQAPFGSDIEYHLPKYLIGHKYFKKLYEKKRREFLKVINGLENSCKPDTEKLEKYKFWLKELEKYESE